jgi:hypothetical protein
MVPSDRDDSTATKIQAAMILLSRRQQGIPAVDVLTGGGPMRILVTVTYFERILVTVTYYRTNIGD